MQIPSDPTANQLATDLAASQAAKPRTVTVVKAQPKVPPVEQSVSTQNTSVATSPDPSVTFRRDANGQIYYVVTDSESGKELRQIPAEEIRKVGEGIADYLKQEQKKPTPHIQVKA